MDTPTEHHRSLARQLRRLGLDAERVPEIGDWSSFLDLVSAFYREADADRYTLERSIAISSEEMRSLYDSLRHQAIHDPLTGLCNQAGLNELLGEALIASSRSTGDAGVLFIDLDGIDQVTDSIGRSAGDELLLLASQRIRKALSAHDVLARLGGDQFVALLERIDGVESVTAMAHRIGKRLDDPFHVGGREALVSASFGAVVLSQGSPTTTDDVLRKATMAMYHAKTSGRGRVVVFDDELRLSLDARLSTENALRYAVDHDELVLYYQPIVRLVDHALVGMEALLRWNRPHQGLVMPDHFLPIAEESSLITEIDSWVLNQACRSAAGWLNSDATVAVNFSARDLQSEHIVSAVTGALDRSGLDPHRLTVELTETTLLADIPVIELNLSQIRALGVQVSIDDFGTGYSSLSYLRKIPAQTLKIDRSFVAVLDEDSAAQAIIAAIVTLGHALNMEIIAEGVEHPSQSAQLRALSCDSAQGYFFARPSPETEIPRFFNGDPIGTWSYEPAISGHVARSGRDRRFG